MTTPEAPAATNTAKKMVDLLRTRHPHWTIMAASEDLWGAYRCVWERMRSKAAKERYLKKCVFEKDDHYAARVGMTRPRPILPTVIKKFHGLMFDDQATIDCGADADLEEWSRNVDLQGTSLIKWIEGVADEAAVMGIVGCFVDRSIADPAKMALHGLSAEQLTTKAAQQKVDGWAPYLVPVKAEEIVNWQVDKCGRPLFVTIERIVDEQPSPFVPAVRYMEWLVMDRERVWRFRSEMEEVQEPSRILDEEGKPLTDAAGVPVMNKVWRPKETVVGDLTGIPHGAGRVPFAWLPGDEKGPLMGDSLFPGTVQADLAYLHEDSLGTFARYLHNVPLFKIWLSKNRSVKDVLRDNATALKFQVMDGGGEQREDAEYGTTPSDAFEVTEKVLERLALDAYRQGNADPTGLIDAGGSRSESGVRARERFMGTEGRTLRAFSTNLALFARDILEIAKRRISATPAAVDANVCTGTVRYPEQFQDQQLGELADLYLEMKGEIKSERFHRVMLQGFARWMMGDVDPKFVSEVQDDIEKQVIEIGPQDPPEPVSDPTQSGQPRLRPRPGAGAA